MVNVSLRAILVLCRLSAIRLFYDEYKNPPQITKILDMIV